MRFLTESTPVRAGNVTIGEIAKCDRGWIAVDDRHGMARASLHAEPHMGREDAIAAVKLRASRTAKQLDELAAEMARRVELRKSAADVCEYLAELNAIGRVTRTP